MLVALLSLKSSPGVTTGALALAGFWPGGRRAQLIEADPAGGEVGCWYQIPGEAHLAALATAGRHASDPQLVAEHAAELPGGLAVVTAPPGPEQAQAAVDLLAREGAGLLRALRADDAVTVIDIGRLDPSSPARGIVRHADVVLLLARPVLAEITRVAARIEAVKAEARQDAQVAVVLHGRGYPPGEIEATLRTPVLGTLPRDEHAAAVLAGRASTHRGLERTALARAAHALGNALDHGAATTPGRALISQVREAHA